MDAFEEEEEVVGWFAFTYESVVLKMALRCDLRLERHNARHHREAGFMADPVDAVVRL